ncbi:hypothetical protein OHB26_32125 [Nocardia sp. NBC_01503]|uniref:hypothetical protein n=1 Tax=Nocardia sp. NBC_01503 TaxID=2975997 RepID=UPI002E7B50EE|nr:hypothetical protein [Nocardia sp. NBC_01503]WTL31514.1 hypothetical protein OHB26_32125 [Nocardia sp. NBC_01503]
MRRITSTAILLAAAISVASGTSSATPDSGSTAVNYTATPGERSTVITTDGGALAVRDGVFTITAADGTVLAGTELSFRVDDFVFPIQAEIKDHTATLTPQFDTEHAVYKPVALPYENQAPWRTEYDREQAAWARMGSTIQMGAGIGTLVGSLGGAAVGCLLGGIAGATVAAAAIIGLFGAFLPAAAIGCIGGVMALGALGTLAGTLLIAAPVAIMAAVQYFTTINQPAPKPQPAK